MYRTLAVALSLIARVPAPSPAEAAEAAKSPNVVVILADDLGYGDVHRLNPARGKIKTPHIDKLASQGMTFTDCA